MQGISGISKEFLASRQKLVNVLQGNLQRLDIFLRTWVAGVLVGFDEQLALAPKLRPTILLGHQEERAPLRFGLGSHDFKPALPTIRITVVLADDPILRILPRPTHPVVVGMAGSVVVLADLLELAAHIV